MIKLKNITSIIAISILSIFICSCSSSMYVNINYKKTNNLIDKLMEKNGNAFSLEYDNNDFSYVFSLQSNGVTKWIELKRGKIIKELDIEGSKFDITNNDFKLITIDLNCYEGNTRDAYLRYRQKNNMLSTNNGMELFESLNYKCLDSIKKNDDFLNYLSYVINDRKPYPYDEQKSNW